MLEKLFSRKSNATIGSKSWAKQKRHTCVSYTVTYLEFLIGLFLQECARLFRKEFAFVSNSCSTERLSSCENCLLYAFPRQLTTHQPHQVAYLIHFLATAPNFWAMPQEKSGSSKKKKGNDDSKKKCNEESNKKSHNSVKKGTSTATKSGSTHKSGSNKSSKKATAKPSTSGKSSSKVTKSVKSKAKPTQSKVASKKPTKAQSTHSSSKKAAPSEKVEKSGKSSKKKPAAVAAPKAKPALPKVEKPVEQPEEYETAPPVEADPSAEEEVAPSTKEESKPKEKKPAPKGKTSKANEIENEEQAVESKAVVEEASYADPPSGSSISPEPSSNEPDGAAAEESTNEKPKAAPSNTEAEEGSGVLGEGEGEEGQDKAEEFTKPTINQMKKEKKEKPLSLSEKITKLEFETLNDEVGNWEND